MTSFLGGHFIKAFIARIKTWMTPSHEDLLAEKKRLKETVLYWRYPNGAEVPPEKRHQVMEKLNRIIALLDDYPEDQIPSPLKTADRPNLSAPSKDEFDEGFDHWYYLYH